MLSFGLTSAAAMAARRPAPPPPTRRMSCDRISMVPHWRPRYLERKPLSPRALRRTFCHNRARKQMEFSNQGPVVRTHISVCAALSTVLLPDYWLRAGLFFQIARHARVELSRRWRKATAKKNRAETNLGAHQNY